MDALHNYGRVGCGAFFLNELPMFKAQDSTQ